MTRTGYQHEDVPKDQLPLPDSLLPSLELGPLLYFLHVTLWRSAHK